MVVLRAIVDENRKLIIELPEDFPSGEVEVKVESVKISGQVTGAIVSINASSVEAFPVSQNKPDWEKLTQIPEPVPLNIPEDMLKIGALRRNPDGVALVGKTRVPLDTVIYSFRQGNTPEQIIQHFTTLALVDVYAVIAFYLRERASVDKYIRQRKHQAKNIRQAIEEQFPAKGLRQRLLARRKARE